MGNYKFKILKGPLICIYKEVLTLNIQYAYDKKKW